MTRPPGVPATWTDKEHEGAAPFTWAWPYHDAAGAVLGLAARFDWPDDKAVLPFFVHEKGAWKTGAAPAPRPLYNLDRLAKAGPGEAVYIVEGEKCAAAMAALGFLATTSPGGCQAANKADWGPLQGFGRVVLLPDNDTPGQAYAADVCRALAALPGTREIVVCRLPGLSEGGDIIDYLREPLADSWNGFDPPPRDAGDELETEMREVIEAHTAPAPPEWLSPTGAVAAAPEPWTPPIPLDAGTIPEWPPNVFPPVLDAFSNALASSLEVPREAAAMLSLVACAAVAQRTYELRIKADYSQPLALWAAVVLPPASRKTGVQGATTRPLMHWQAEQRAKLEPVIAKAQSEAKTLTTRVEHLRAKTARAKSEEVPDLLREIEALEHDVLIVPTVPRVVADDVTPEHLAGLMEANAESMGVMSDESGVLGIIGGRYSKNGGANPDLWLKAHEGSPVVVDRISRASVHLLHPALTVGLCLQPDVLYSLRNTPEFRGRGLLGRFLWIVPPCNIGKRSLSGPPMPQDVERAYQNMIRAILAHERTPDGKRHTLTLSDDARTLWHVFGLRLQSAMSDGGELEHVRDWAGKLAAAIARIAGVMHVSRYADGEPAARPVDVQDMRNAIRVGEVLIRHALQAFDAMAADPNLDGARAILRWIEREGRATFTRRDCHYDNKSRFRLAKDLDAALGVLVERCYIRPQTLCAPLGKGRPSKTYEVNRSTVHR